MYQQKTNELETSTIAFPIWGGSTIPDPHLWRMAYIKLGKSEPYQLNILDQIISAFVRMGGGIQSSSTLSKLRI